jgi:chemotaxis phosphatase CheX-like protein
MPYHESPMPTPTETDDALYVALLHVCERSFFAFVETCDRLQFAVLVGKTQSQPPLQDVDGLDAMAAQLPRWLKASVAFDGNSSSGAIEIVLPERLARWLVASLLGITTEVDLGQVELLDRQVFDGTGEFVNMVCGAWLTDRSGSEAFSLGSPAVTRLPAGWSALEDSSNEPPGLRVSVNDLPLQIFVRSSTA